VRILVVEDEQKVADALREGLEGEKYQVVVERTGEHAFFRVNTETFDAILLDLTLPGRDGLDILRALRARGLATPVLVLTARDSLQDRVTGLDSGADDYLVKPFAIAELTARLQALLRRRGSAGAGPLVVGDIVVDARRHVATRGGRDLGLTRREFDLLEVFARHPGQVLSREQLLRLVWGYASDVETNVVDVFVGYVRRKLEAGGEPRTLHTVRGVGWALRP
jgi:DNA-binding response OmpR family regulator